MRAGLLMLAALVGITLWFRYDNLQLSRALEHAGQVVSDQKQTIGTLQQQLVVSQEIARTNELAQVRLRDELAAAGEEMTKREAAIGRLVNENEALRRWYGNKLPDVVRRLHVRTACASAAHCVQRVPEGEFLSDAGK
ncbi:TPA: LysB family phage lysis regulatory protein [Enterobacter cancerogenus]|nr:LysB family phage lysis regulatory protein [Enterobacter cancerogenus]HDR2163640.1 LysB family phage lysis regulatory protein [Enterobacter cancerogenus]HDR2266778.1 LysB family phage lysis regulatory protein [Enterobacter cancerogenus]